MAKKKRQKDQNPDPAFKFIRPREEREAMLTSVVDAANLKFGTGTIQSLEGTPNVPIFPFQVSTGSLGLDLLLGPVRKLPNGFWQRGMAPARMLEVFGPEGSGKTTIALQAAAYMHRWLSQGIYTDFPNEVAYIDTEHSLDPTYAKRLGVDTDRLKLSQPNSGEEAVQVADMLLNSGVFGLIVIDSVASLTTRAELDGDITDDHIGLQARLMSQALRQWAGDLSVSMRPTVILFINQEREKIRTGPHGGGGTTTPGGRALKYYTNYRIRVFPTGAIMSGNNQVGHNLSFKVVKNKVLPPMRTAEAPLWYGLGIHRMDELARMCQARGLIETSGAWYSHPRFPRKLQGLGSVVEFLTANPAVAYQLYDEFLTQHNFDQGLTPEGDVREGWTPPATDSVSDFQQPLMPGAEVVDTETGEVITKEDLGE